MCGRYICFYLEDLVDLVLIRVIFGRLRVGGNVWFFWRMFLVNGNVRIEVGDILDGGISRVKV